MAIGQNSLARKIERYNRLVDKATGREIVYLDFCKASDKKIFLTIGYLSGKIEVCVLGD